MRLFSFLRGRSRSASGPANPPVLIEIPSPPPRPRNPMARGSFTHIELPWLSLRLPGESWTRFEMLDGGLPKPELQLAVRVGGQEKYRLDMGYEFSRVGVEYDGVDHSSDDQRAHDAERRAWLRDRGWKIIVVTKDDFDADSRRSWLGEVRAVLGLPQ